MIPGSETADGTGADGTLVAYRYEAVRISTGTDEFGEYSTGYRVSIQLRTYPILRETPKGFWIDVYGVPRFVLNTAHKRFACLTITEAKESFAARKARQKKILQEQLEYVHRQIDQLQCLALSPSF